MQISLYDSLIHVHSEASFHFKLSLLFLFVSLNNNALYTASCTISNIPLLLVLNHSYVSMKQGWLIATLNLEALLKPPSTCPLYTHPGTETQARGLNYHTETVLVIID